MNLKVGDLCKICSGTFAMYERFNNQICIIDSLEGLYFRVVFIRKNLNNTLVAPHNLIKFDNKLSRLLYLG